MEQMILDQWGLCSEKSKFDLGITLLRAAHVCSSVEPALGEFS